MRREGHHCVAAALVCLTMLFGGRVLDAQFPEYDSGWQRGRDVSPTFDGWERNSDGTYSFYFGYLNRNASEELDISLGPDNLFDAGEDRGQPTHFYPGRRWWVFKVIVPAEWPKDRRLVWTLKSRGRTNQAKAWLQPEWEISPDLIPRNARDPFLFGRSAIDEHNRPPSISGVSRLTVTLPQTLSVSVRVTDDGPPQPQQPVQDAARPPGLRLRWALFRGRGPVQFSPETLGLAAARETDAATSVSFSSPGQYRLRAIVSDGAAFATFDVDVTVLEAS